MQSSIHYLEKLKEEKEIKVEVIMPEKGKPEGIISLEIRSEDKQNYAQQKDENEKLIQLLEHIKGIQKEHGYDEYHSDGQWKWIY